MFNTVNRSIACVSVLQTNHKYPYAIDFKMACLIVRKYYRLHNNEPPAYPDAVIIEHDDYYENGKFVSDEYTYYFIIDDKELTIVKAK